MKLFTPQLSRIHSLLVITLITGLAILQGCESLTEVEQGDHISKFDQESPSATAPTNKLRHAALLRDAKRTRTDQASKLTLTTTDLFLGFNTYEADGITPRLINKFDLTNRILNEYGITRRVLSKYGITKRVLDQYGITRRVLNQYGITRRVLGKYGITPRILRNYGDQVTDELLDEYGITDAKLASEGLTRADLNDFNTLSELVNTHNTSVEEFVSDLDSHFPDVRVKVYIDGSSLGISVSVTDAILDAFLEEVETDNDIVTVEPDVQINVSNLGRTSGEWFDNQITPWGINEIRAPIPGIQSVLSEDYIRKNPVHVYILDSGAMQDTWLDDLNYVEKKDFTMLFENPDQLTWDEDLAPDVSGFDPGNAGNPYDETGHGTHIAGTIGAHNNLHGVVGVAPSVRIHSLKVLNARGQTDITTLLAAVDYVTRAKKDNPDRPIVVNMSFGVDIGTKDYNILDEAIEASIKEGVIFVAAAGNDGKDAETYSPAHVKDVITVGSYNQNRTFSNFSNYGKVVDILAPGEDIISLSHVIADTRSFQSILNSGTSHAAPHITGAIARYLGEKPKADAKDVLKALEKASKKEIEGVPSKTTELALDVSKLIKSKKVKKDEDNEDNKDSRRKYWENKDNDENDDHDTDD